MKIKVQSTITNKLKLVERIGLTDFQTNIVNMKIWTEICVFVTSSRQLLHGSGWNYNRIFINCPNLLLTHGLEKTFKRFHTNIACESKGRNFCYFSLVSISHGDNWNVKNRVPVVPRGRERKMDLKKLLIPVLSLKKIFSNF